MNVRSLIFAAALVAGPSVSAVTWVAPAEYAAPAPATVVAPHGHPRSHLGAVVTLRLNADAAGQPSNFQVLSARDPALTKRLVPAVSPWQFSPARHHSVAVGAKTEVPRELPEG